MNIEDIVQKMKEATDFIDSDEFQYAGNEEKESLDKQLYEMETHIKLMIHQLHEDIEKETKELQIKENKLITLMRITSNYGIDMWHHYAEDRLELNKMSSKNYCGNCGSSDIFILNKTYTCEKCGHVGEI